MPNVKCQMPNLKKLTCKGTLQQVFYLSEAPSPPYDPILTPPPLTLTPPYTLYTCIQYTEYNFFPQKGEGGRANQREG
jgi:hypothetical protein